MTDVKEDKTTADAKEKLVPVRKLLSKLSEAQGGVESCKSVKEITAHLRSTTYPLLSESMALICDVGDSVEDLVDAAKGNNDEEYIDLEHAQNITDFVDGVFRVVVDLTPLAKEQASKGDNSLFNQLGLLYRTGAAVKELVLSMTDEVVVEEVDANEHK